jgi:hypothetical protein
MVQCNNFLATGTGAYFLLKEVEHSVRILVVVVLRQEQSHVVEEGGQIIGGKLFQIVEVL